MPTAKKTTQKLVVKAAAKTKPIVKAQTAKPVRKAKAVAKTGKISKTGAIKKSVAAKTGIVKKTVAPSKPVAAVKKVPAKKIAPKKTTAPAVPPFDAKNLTRGFDLVKKCVLALDEKKAENLRVIHIGEKSSITNYFIIATGNSEPHLRALRIAVEKELDGANAAIIGRESQSESGWTVVDAFDLIVHLFLPNQRANYQFESLWKDGEEITQAIL